MPLINCEINHFLTYSANCAISAKTRATFRITDPEMYFPGVIYQLKIM